MILQSADYGNYATYLKLYPAFFGKKQAESGCAMAKSVTQYISALYLDEDFKKDFIKDGLLESVNAKTLNQLYSEQSYKRYVEGYEWTIEELKVINDEMLKEGFSKYQFNSVDNCIKYIRAVKDILYHANAAVIEDAVKKLTAWLQGFRLALSQDKSIKIDATALFFYSPMGGTGKSELLNSFVGACDRMNISHAHLSTQDISDKFSPKAIKEVNAVIIEDAEFIGGKFGNDVNLAKVNALIDRQEITYNQKMMRSEQVRPNLSIIGSTNNRYSNRRYSVIVIRNSEIDLEKHNPPTLARLVHAWMDAITFCPDPHVKFVSVKTKNQRSPFVITDNMIKIFNLVNDDDSSFETVGMRKIIDYCTKGSVNPRAENIVKDDVRMLIKLGIANQVKKNPRWGLGVSKIEFDMFKFRDFIDTDETDEKSISVADVETAVINNYI
ncbi:MAG: hypothetical protein LBL00_08505, partial [Endomicrobium sp.]|nr:hypothetical protein [Endomicrobium sp.]